MLFALIVLIAQTSEPCAAALALAEARVLRGESEVSRTLSDTCADMTLARLALRGWDEARELAPKGGAAELLGPVQSTLSALDAWRDGDLALEAEYAQIAIRAAIAAAQDERGDMELFLTHARDLSERLASRRRRAVWPRAFSLLAGELWFEVDRYEEARRAFERATRGDATPVAFAGLARAHARSDNRAAACDAYRRVRDAAPPLMTEARTYLATCP